MDRASGACSTPSGLELRPVSAKRCVPDHRRAWRSGSGDRPRAGEPLESPADPFGTHAATARRGNWKSAALEAGSTSDRIKQQICKLIEIKSMGAERCWLLRGDVCRRDDVRRALELGSTRFGSINGVIHAAGVIEDGPLQTKSRESAARVLDPKVKGTLVLDDVMRELRSAALEKTQPDFFAALSSVSSSTAAAPARSITQQPMRSLIRMRSVGRTNGLWRSIGDRGGMSAWRRECRHRIRCSVVA